jgi:hypothetical protein
MSLNPTRLTADPAVVAVVHYGPSNLNSMTYIPNMRKPYSNFNLRM